MRRRGGRAFSVRLVHENLDAAIRVAAYMTRCPTRYFRGLAAHWDGWTGSIDWSSFDEELLLSALNDGRGHIQFAVVLGGGVCPREWKVWASLDTEAGLLDGLAADCERVLGSDWPWQ